MVKPATQPKIMLSTPLGEVPGVHHNPVRRLAGMGIQTVTHLIQHWPMRYEQELAESSIANLPQEGIGSTRGTVT